MSQRISSLAKPRRNAAMYAAWLACGNKAEVARRFGVSDRTVFRAVARMGRTLPGGYGPPSRGLHRGYDEAVFTDCYEYLAAEAVARGELVYTRIDGEAA